MAHKTRSVTDKAQVPSFLTRRGTPPHEEKGVSNEEKGSREEKEVSDEGKGCLLARGRGAFSPRGWCLLTRGRGVFSRGEGGVPSRGGGVSREKSAQDSYPPRPTCVTGVPRRWGPPFVLVSKN